MQDQYYKRSKKDKKALEDAWIEEENKEISRRRKGGRRK